jgi:hypothetical protein
MFIGVIVPVLIIIFLSFLFLVLTDIENNYRIEIVEDIILEKFENQEWVQIVIDCDNSEALLSDLDETNIKLRYTYSRGGFSAEVTRVGLNIIKRDPHVTRIQFNHPLVGT